MTRNGKELLSATRPFIEQSQAESWWYVCSTFAILIATLTFAGLAPWWPARLAASILGGAVMTRAFILYHDFMHGSILGGSWPARLVLHGLGLLMLVPPRSWRSSHNYHHANVAKLNVTVVGSYPIMTTAAWRQASRGQRFRYRLSRHPLTILSAYLTIFGFTITVEPLLKHPRKNWDSALALLVHGGAIAGLWVLGGPSLAFFVLVLPFALAAALGAYLFYAQHSFLGIGMLPPEEWTYYGAALESSSYLKMGRIMSWLAWEHRLSPCAPSQPADSLLPPTRCHGRDRRATAPGNYHAAPARHPGLSAAESLGRGDVTHGELSRCRELVPHTIDAFRESPPPRTKKSTLKVTEPSNMGRLGLDCYLQHSISPRSE